MINMVLNTEKYKLIEGKPEKWDEDLKTQIVDHHRDLNEVLYEQYMKGRRMASLVPMQSKYGIMIEMTSIIDNEDCWIVKNVDLDEALHIGKNWTLQDESNREFYAHKRLLPDEI